MFNHGVVRCFVVGNQKCISVPVTPITGTGVKQVTVEKYSISWIYLKY